MNRILFDHYRDDMIRYLKDMLRSGYLKEIVGFPFQNKKLYRNNYDFSEVFYWRVDRETFIADVRVDLYLNTGNAIRTWNGFLNLWFYLGEKITCSIEYLASAKDMADEDLTRLSSYLVPILSNRQVDETAEAIWAIHLPEALYSPEQRSAVNLAHKMGLSIQYLPVYHHQDTDSILFFEECCLRFIRQYTQKGVGKYVFGRMNYDSEYVKQTLFYVEDYTMKVETDEFTAAKKYKENFPDSFREAFAQIRKRNNLSIEKTAELMNMSDSTLKRWIREPDDRITIDFVITVALALKLPDWLSELLLDRAHKCLSTANRRHLALRWILRVQWSDGITAANDFLKAKGLEPLQI